MVEVENIKSDNDEDAADKDEDDSDDEDDEMKALAEQMEKRRTTSGRKLPFGSVATHHIDIVITKSPPLP